MAYRKRYGRSKKIAGKVARKVSRKAYRGALKMPKRKLAKIYATKCGQVAFRAAKRKRGGRYGRRMRRM